MPTVAFQSEDFLGLVLPGLPYCPVPLAVQKLRLAAREFFRMSWVWRADHAAIALVANQATYALTVPTGAEIRALCNVRLEGTRFDPVHRAVLESQYSDWAAQTAEKPQRWFMADESTLQVWPKPTANLANAITCRLILRPTLTASGIEDRLFNLHADGIAHGAISELQRMPGNPWTNFDSAVIEAGLFKRAWADAKIAADRDGSDESVLIEFPSE